MALDVNVLARIGVALLVGLLVGLDRERAELRKSREEFAGVRTFPLIGLAGCLGVLLVPAAGPWILAATFLAVAAIAVVAYARSSRDGHVGATTEIAAITVFLLGAAAGAGELLLAGAAGVIVAVLLVAKPRLESFSRALSPEELSAVLELAVISVIVLPLLPDRGYGPWSLLNPREIWWVVVLVAGLSFAGFVAVRVLGEQRGLAVTGLVGGLVSSTAVTLAMSERSRADAGSAHAAAGAAVLASTVMAARVFLLAGAINRGILAGLVPPVAAMVVTGIIAAWFVTRGGAGPHAEAGERIRNPFSTRTAVSFALVYGAVLLVSRAAHEQFGSSGVFVTAALASVADVDAVTIAVTRMGPGASAWRVGAAAVTLALVMNTLVKLTIAMTRGAGSYRRMVGAALGAMAVAGAVAGVIR